MQSTALMALAVAALVVAGGALKVTRYAGRPSVDATTAQQGAIDAISGRMARAGWQRTAIAAGPKLPFATLYFSRTSCPHQVALSLIGSSRELLPLVKLIHGDDVSLVDGSDRNAAGGELGDARSDIARFVGSLSERHTLVAITPASALQVPGCAVPIEVGRQGSGDRPA